VNHIEISGKIEDLRFVDLVATFVLAVGFKPQSIRVIARGGAVEELKRFCEGELVRVEGRLSWSPTVEIFAEKFREHHQGSYQRSKEWRSSVIPKVKGF